MQLQILGSRSQGGLLIEAGQTLRIQTELQYPASSANEPALPAEPHFVKITSLCPFLKVVETNGDGTFDIWNPTSEEQAFEWAAHHLHSNPQDPLHEVTDQGTPIASPETICPLPGLNPQSYHARWVDGQQNPVIPSAPPFYSPPFTQMIDPYVTWGVDAIAGRFIFNRSGLYHITLSCMISGAVTDGVIMWLFQDPAGSLNGYSPFFDSREINLPSTGLQNNKLIAHGTIAIDAADPAADRTFECLLASNLGLASFGDSLDLLGGSIEINRVANNPLAP
jgi:hypothetical protein